MDNWGGQMGKNVKSTFIQFAVSAYISAYLHLEF